MEEKKNEKPVKLDSNKFTEDLSFAFIMYKDKDMESVKHLLVGDYFGVISALLGTVNALREQGVISDDLLLDILNIKDCRGGK
ncbi:MAG: hypothetical protein J6T15_04865 [Bacilli bacterium]|nr:hypothetical protein [Bacilli bacterium]